MNDKRVAIVGGGITGLAAAYYLERQPSFARSGIRYTLIDSGPQLGGKVFTEKVGDFLIEEGPDSFLTQKPWALQLCRELGLAEDLIPTNHTNQRVYVWRRGRLRPIPEGLYLSVPTRVGPLLRSDLISPLGRIRMLLERFLPARRDVADESVASFVRRRFGREALDTVAGPLMAGIYVAEADRLSLQATFPRFRQLECEHGSLTAGIVGERLRATNSVRCSSRNLSAFMTLRGGMGRLTDRLTTSLVGEVLSNCTVQDITYSPGEGGRYQIAFEGSRPSMIVDAVVLATPASTAAGLTADLSSRLSGLLRNIRHQSSVTVSLAFDEADLRRPLDGFGFVVPDGEECRLMACTWTSAKFPERSPGGRVLLRAFLGGRKAEVVLNVGDGEVVRIVLNELQRTMGLGSLPLCIHLRRWVDGNPQYDVGHLDRVSEIESHCPPGLVLAGSSYRGVGIPDCIRQGQEAASAVTGFLAEPISEPKDAVS